MARKEELTTEGRDLLRAFGRRLKHAREAAGLSRKELADMVGRYENTIRKWEAGDQQPPIEALHSVARALKVTVGHLYGEVGSSTALDRVAEAVMLVLVRVAAGSGLYEALESSVALYGPLPEGFAGSLPQVTPELRRKIQEFLAMRMRGNKDAAKREAARLIQGWLEAEGRTLDDLAE